VNTVESRSPAQAVVRTVATIPVPFGTDGRSPLAHSPLASPSCSEAAILNSALTGPQATAFENAVLNAGNETGIDPNILVGIAMKESTLNPSAQSGSSSASGLFQLTSGVQGAYNLSEGDATGTSPSAIGNQVNAAANYLYDLTQGSVLKSNPTLALEIGIAYYRGSRRAVSRAIASPNGYNAMLRLSYQGETIGQYLSYVEAFANPEPSSSS
jgi:hypothetical protein